MTEYHLTTPISEEDARKLKTGDIVYVTGEHVYTARDEAHERALEMYEKGEKPPVDFEGSVVYHVGPVAWQKDGKWEIVSAGPTTSIRMELFEDEFLRKYKARIIIGKGGMGAKTLNALKEVGAVYCSFTGGCGALAAKGLKEVRAYLWDDLGMPEALWVITAEEFGPLLVTMDSHGKSIHDEMDRTVAARKAEVYAKIGIKE
ncbi:MAG: fumarate hydratase C-terminal domain-containing protein [Candidatus Thorarchaeota archaeon]|jgi:tartrate/fumarate subfamily iron-sulfur-dependent hydro-lyase beta chain|nr:fumarate hydratase C-terminal domain-containing protein [Candidatus Thorarchaeota archaeon]